MQELLYFRIYAWQQSEILVFPVSGFPSIIRFPVENASNMVRISQVMIWPVTLLFDNRFDNIWYLIVISLQLNGLHNRPPAVLGLKQHSSFERTACWPNTLTLWVRPMYGASWAWKICTEIILAFLCFSLVWISVWLRDSWNVNKTPNKCQMRIIGVFELNGLLS